MTQKPSLEEVINANRTLIILIVSMPIFGMLIAIVLILYKQPDNMLVVLGVIVFIMVQYAVMVFFITKRMDKLGKTEKKNETSEDKNSEVFIE
ncbi:MAG: hypothetical protein NWE89_05490 [Candidatus Bathyarchaeota archaeon]|nr:hypothetical protein [Candidatus Bathyarchaeota archaeon]